MPARAITQASTKAAPGSPNPADLPVFRRALLKMVDRLTATVIYSDTNDARPAGFDEIAYRQAIAAAWVSLSCVAVWAEDHQLVEPLLRTAPPGVSRSAASGAVWLGRAFAQLTVHPATQWLMHPAYNRMLWAGSPSPSACTALIDWWATEAPSLAYPAALDYPGSIAGWPIGDLLQLLSPRRRKRHALVQTPHFVADLILDRTLVPAADYFRDEHPLRLIDPACGTGHFLIRAVDYLWQWYTTGVLTARAVSGRPAITGGTIHPPADAVRLILAGVDGVDIDPLTAAVGRFRLTVYIAHLMASCGLLPTPLRPVGGPEQRGAAYRGRRRTAAGHQHHPLPVRGRAPAAGQPARGRVPFLGLHLANRPVSSEVGVPGFVGSHAGLALASDGDCQNGVLLVHRPQSYELWGQPAWRRRSSRDTGRGQPGPAQHCR
jgi:hypothetical protein